MIINYIAIRVTKLHIKYKVNINREKFLFAN